jgi:hypothetical protein
MPEVNGTTYHPDTKPEIIALLEKCRMHRMRVRFRYGDDDGQDWGDTCDMEGYIGRSCGQYKVPLVIYNSRTIGGPAILTARIVRIETTKGKRVLYQHPAYKPPKEADHAMPPM